MPARRRRTSTASFSARSAAVAWSASGRSRFCTSRLEIACSFDLDLDTRELQLRTVPAPLEAAEPCSLLDERAALGRARREDRLDAALADDGARRRAEPDVREQLDDVGAPHGAPLIRYWPSPPRWRRRVIATSS